jgi:glycosyltransferase involved in cell wall biosynthesis
LRIAQIAPLYESTPPKFYGGTERIVSALTDELVARGYDVTLFATADSLTSARLVPMVETGLRLGHIPNALERHLMMLEAVYARADEFDLIHSHVDTMALWFAQMSATPTVHTLHGRLDLPETPNILRCYTGQHLISISDSQRDPVRNLQLCWLGTVRNGIVLHHFAFRAAPDSPPYLIYVGEIAPGKGPAQAIEVARRAGLRLKIAAKIDPVFAGWAAEHVLPLLSTSGVEYLGEVDDASKAKLLGGALAVLSPVAAHEPVGMVMAEALACGTPVIALASRAVAEVIDEGVTGLICNSADEMVAASQLVDQIDRLACRRNAETRFTSTIMTDGYEEIYKQVLASQGKAV